MSAQTQDGGHSSRAPVAGLALGALGVVYGDIGTSPLYAIKECFTGPHALPVNPVNVMGVLSLIFWSLSFVITIKYVTFVLRADNKGEGGMFSLLELLPRLRADSPKAYAKVAFLGLCGASLLYGDGVITPAISVLSALEGLEVATTAATPFIVPATCLILLGLFLIQRRGTQGIGRVFGPVTLVWFSAIGLCGILAIIENPMVLRALNPAYAAAFFAANSLHGFVVLGAVVLCITGGEALYADMGHFGKTPIRISWLIVVFPMLLCNYFGQGARLLINPAAAANPFYGAVPSAFLYPMVALATMATVIASQAMISGVFSLTRQAVQLGYYPRMRIVHTSSDFEGQIYLPGVNWALMAACIALVLVFRQSSGLAGAYGIAVTASMTCTSVLMGFVARTTWGWPLWRAMVMSGMFLCFDLTYLGSNLAKVFDGGWIALTIAVLLVLAMTTWKRGRLLLTRRLADQIVPLDVFHRDVGSINALRLPGAAVFMSVSPTGTPVTLAQFFRHTGAIYEKNFVLSIAVADTPVVADDQKVSVQDLGDNFYRIIARYGFMESPNAPWILSQVNALGVNVEPTETTYFLGRESLLVTGAKGMSLWRKALFSLMSRNSRPASSFFGLPPDRVVELGLQIEL